MKYKLYRNLHDIIHPSISRKNISDYEIVMDDKVVSVNIFYPAIGVEISKAIIYIPDKIKNHDIYIDLAKETENLILVINYTDKNKFNDCYNIIKYIYNNIEEAGINKEDITIMSDYAGSTLEMEVIEKSNMTKDFVVSNTIMIDPKKQIDAKIMNNNKILVITDNNSKQTKKEFKKINSYLSGFVKGDNLAASENVYSLINEFLR